jgi:hypothetical protein
VNASIIVQIRNDDFTGPTGLAATTFTLHPLDDGAFDEELQEEYIADWARDLLRQARRDFLLGQRDEARQLAAQQALA